MDEKDLFRVALGLAEPWYVATIEFNARVIGLTFIWTLLKGAISRARHAGNRVRPMILRRGLGAT